MCEDPAASCGAYETINGTGCKIYPTTSLNAAERWRGKPAGAAAGRYCFVRQTRTLAHFAIKRVPEFSTSIDLPPYTCTKTIKGVNMIWKADIIAKPG
jgi:hypothetical protein